MSRKNGSVSGADDEQNGDPFADFGLTDEAREFFQADEPKAGEPQVKGTPPAANRSPPRSPAKSGATLRTEAPTAAHFKWEPADFETPSGPLAKDCASCFHYVRGGKFAVDNIHEVSSSGRGTLHRVITDCKKHEREFELHELEQMIEKCKTLDTQFDGVPRIRHYCFAGSMTWNLLAHIPEIKNYDGKCKDYLPGSRPRVSCDTCTHLSEPYKKRPNALARSVDISGFRSVMRDADLDRTRNLIGSMRREYQRRDEMAKMEEDDYEQKLSDDIMTMVYDNRSPSNGTLNQCKENSLRACVAENRTNHCPKFSISGRLETIAGEARWRELTISNKKYREEADLLIDAEKAKRAKFSEGAERSLAHRPRCFSCVHQRAPVDNDLFREIHFNSPDIMNLRDGYRREKKQREAEERLICTQPSKALGSEFPPQRQAWCEKYSTRAQGGKVQEYAYCLRVLKNHGGDCPSYERSREDQHATVELPPLLPTPPPPAPTAQPPFLDTEEQRDRFRKYVAKSLTQLEANAKGAAGRSAEAPALSGAPKGENAAAPAAAVESFEAANPGRARIDDPIMLRVAREYVSNLALQVERGSAFKDIEANRGLRKSEKRARFKKARQEARQEVVGELLSAYEKALKQTGALTGEQLAGHLVTRSTHGRRENWHRNEEPMIDAAGEKQQCGRCKSTLGLFLRGDKLWCLTCTDWAAPP